LETGGTREEERPDRLWRGLNLGASAWFPCAVTMSLSAEPTSSSRSGQPVHHKTAQSRASLFLRARPTVRQSCGTLLPVVSSAQDQMLTSSYVGATSAACHDLGSNRVLLNLRGGTNEKQEPSAHRNEIRADHEGKVPRTIVAALRSFGRLSWGEVALMGR
jgi:hypothetical protein